MRSILDRRVALGPSGWQTLVPVGRHANSSGSLLGLRRTARISGLVGGLAWVLGFFVPDGNSLDGLLVGIGAVLLTIALFGLGLLLVRSDFLGLRLFVAVALPTLVWAVFSLVHGSAGDPELVDAVFGAAVGLCAAVPLARRRTAPRATL
jgi:hypothetical protein